MTATVDETARPDGRPETPGIDAERLALCLAVIAEAEALDR
ncbi:hypothetical protein EDD30_0001, partial [Couchioplanes caeruleus]